MLSPLRVKYGTKNIFFALCKSKCINCPICMQKLLPTLKILFYVSLLTLNGREASIAGAKGGKMSHCTQAILTYLSLSLISFLRAFLKTR